MSKSIYKEVVIHATVADVWRAWTSQEGVTSFFSRKANLELKIGGKYEMLFNLEVQKGSQGSEGIKILSYLPEKMLSFDWNAPPNYPKLRNERTWVVLNFQLIDDENTRVILNHLGWGKSSDWEQVYNYFERAWDIVLGRLQYRFLYGPIDWDNPYTPN